LTRLPPPPPQASIVIRDEDMLPDEDTCRTMLRHSKEQLALVQQVLDEGRITRDQRNLISQGPWLMGELYRTANISIKLCVAAEVTESPIRPWRHMNSKTVYVGVAGSANVYVGTTYMRVTSCNIASVNMGEEHVVEPLEEKTQLLLMLIRPG